MCGTRRTASRATPTTPPPSAPEKWRCLTTFATTIMAPCWMGRSLIPGLFYMYNILFKNTQSHTHTKKKCTQICNLSPPSFAVATHVCVPMTLTLGLGGWLLEWIRAFWECVSERDASSRCHRHSDMERMEMVSILFYYLFPWIRVHSCEWLQALKIFHSFENNERLMIITVQSNRRCNGTHGAWGGSTSHAYAVELFFYPLGLVRDGEYR